MLQVVLRMDSEADQRLRALDAVEGANLLRHERRQCFGVLHPDDDNEVMAAGHRVHLANALKVGERFSDGRDLALGDVEQYDGSGHKEGMGDIGEGYEATAEAGVRSASSCSFSPTRLK